MPLLRVSVNDVGAELRRFLCLQKMIAMMMTMTTTIEGIRVPKIIPIVTELSRLEADLLAGYLKGGVVKETCCVVVSGAWVV